MENLRKQIQELETYNEELEEKIRAKKSEKATRTARITAQIFLEKIFAPYMSGVCNTWGVSPEEALRILIDDEATLGKIAIDNPADLEKLKNEPAVKGVLKIATPLGNVSDEWIKEKMNVLLDVMWEIRPSMANAIITTPGGTEWFYDSLVGLRNILFDKPQLK